MLAKQVIPIDFSGGLDKQTDPKLVIPGKLTQLDNGVFDSANTISKSGGYSAMSTAILTAGGSIGAAKRLARRKNALLLETSTGLWSHLGQTASAQALGRLRVTAQFTRTAVEVKDVVRNDRDQTQFDAASTTAGGRKISVWAFTEGAAGSETLYYTVFDDSTGSPYVLPAVLAFNAALPRVIWDPLSSVFRVYFLRTATNDLEHYDIDPTTLLAANNAVVVADAKNAANSGQFDVAYRSADDSIYLVYRLNAGGFKVAKLTTIGVNRGRTVDTSKTETEDPDRGLALGVYSGGRIGAATINSANGVKAHAWPADLSLFATTVAIQTGTLHRRVGVVPSGVNMQVVYESHPGSLNMDTDCLLRVATVDSVPAVVTAAADLARSVGIVSKPFTVGTANYITAGFFASDQSTLFVLGLSGSISGGDAAGVVARILSGEAGRYAATWGGSRTGSIRLPQALIDLEATGAATIPILRRGALRLVNALDVTPSGLSRATVFFTTTSRPLQRTEFADLAVFAGGCPLAYDGVSVFEAGFHTAPDSGKVVLSAAAGGGATAGTYQVVIVYEFVDAAGNRWQSEPSTPQSVTLALNQKIVIDAPTDRLTRRYGANNPISERVVAYVTTSDGTVFYRSTDVGNSVTTDTVQLEHTQTDAQLDDNELLYTTGGVLENTPWPACRALGIHQERLFFVGLEDPYEIRYTERRRLGHPGNTNSAYSIRCPADRGELTAVGSMDDKLIAFAEKRAFYVSGEGPNRLGQFDAYSEPMIAINDLGCKKNSPDSLVLTPDGLWFRADQGLRLLTRGLSAARHPETGAFFGAEVDALLDGFVSASATPSKQQVRFYTGTVVLVYDYQWGQWSRFTNHAAVDAAEWDGALVHLESDGDCFKSGGVTHAGTAINLAVESAWLKFAGVQGFQRARQMLLLGTFVGDTTLKVEVGYDYEEFYTSPVSVLISTIASSELVPVQIRNKFARQKCEAIRFRITENNVLGNAGFSLSNMSLEVGVKRGGAKLAGTNTI